MNEINNKKEKNRKRKVIDCDYTDFKFDEKDQKLIRGFILPKKWEERRKEVLNILKTKKCS